MKDIYSKVSLIESVKICQVVYVHIYTHTIWGNKRIHGKYNKHKHSKKTKLGGWLLLGERAAIGRGYTGRSNALWKLDISYGQVGNTQVLVT